MFIESISLEMLTISLTINQSIPLYVGGASQDNIIPPSQCNISSDSNFGIKSAKYIYSLSHKSTNVALDPPPHNNIQ
jgi:hypothetical protein